MNVLCIHCGQTLSISAEQLGTRGRCPHCRGRVRLPRGDRGAVEFRERPRPARWRERTLGLLAALAVHLALAAPLLVRPGGIRREPSAERGEWVRIAVAEHRPLDRQPLHWETAALPRGGPRGLESLHAREPFRRPGGEPRDRPRPQIAARGAAAIDFSPAGNAQETPGQQAFDALVEQLGRDGLDLVITFDTTGSMDGEIRQVKSQIERIGGALFQLVPKTRISLCTYRDHDDVYVVQGLRLTDNLAQVVEYLEGVAAAGGGDEPEAVERGLEWSIRQNDFRPRARKVVLVFGDAPPRPSQREACLTLATRFRREQGGVVSTVTCRSERRLEAFVDIAQAGGGEAFLTTHEREIMTQLMVLIFGSQHREKVIEALRLIGS